MKAVIELVSNMCNSSCRWCFTQYESGKQIKKGMMSKDIFEKIILLNPGLRIIPFSHGEALLHKGFNDMMRFALNNNCRLDRIHSNFALDLDDEYFKTFLKFRAVTINIGGATEKTHRANMGTDFNKVISNIKKLCDYKQRENSRVNIELKMVLNKINIQETDKLKKLANDIDKDIHTATFPIYFSTSDSTQEEMLKFYDNNINDNVPCRDKIIRRNNHIEVISKKTNMKCDEHIFTIRWNGKIQMCCRSRLEEGIVGNATKQSLKQIQKFHYYKYMLKKVKNRTYISYCKYCS